MRTTLARRVILEILARCKPHALPEQTLFTEANIQICPAMGQEEFDEHLMWLQSRKFIAAMEDDLGDDQARWILTRPGEAQLLR